MTDILEDAAEYEQHQRDASIKEVRERKAMPFTGRCLICNTPIKKGQLCGADCQNDYDLEQRIKQISGNFLLRSRR